MEIKKVGVVGFGYMGHGIAQVCAQSGYQVVAIDLTNAILDRQIGDIKSTLSRSVDRGRISQEDMDATLGRIKLTLDPKDFSDCDLMIEAVFENLDVKKQAFAQYDKIFPKHAIMASNSSSLSIMAMAAQTSRLEKTLGLHFFGPVPVMNCLEIVQTVTTNDETMEICRKFGESLGKTVVVAKDTPGFIVNRLLQPFLIQAIRTLELGIATKEDIDTAIRTSLNHPMGPLTLADLIGLDIELGIMDGMFEESKDPQYAAPILLRKMVTAGHLGRKSGKGFYDYSK